MPKPSAPKSPVRLTTTVEDRLIAISLNHPEYGARRLLPLLAAEDILLSESTVYGILRRRGMGNRKMRIAKLEALHRKEAAHAPSKALTDASEDRQQEQAVNENEKQDPAGTAPSSLLHDLSVKVQPAGVPLARAKKFRRRKPSGPLVFKLLNAALVGLFILLGVQNVQRLRTEASAPEFTPPESPAQPYEKSAPRTAVPHIDAYRAIWERDLFRTNAKKSASSGEEIAPERLFPAPKELGLELVGTVIADEPDMNRAFIGDRRAGYQEIFEVGDAVAGVTVKKIMRGMVVVATADGDRILLAGTHAAAEGPPAAQSPLQPPESDLSARAAPLPTADLEIAQSEVQSSLEDLDRLMDEVRIGAYTENDQAAGFQLDGIMGWNILAQMGLRSGDVITAMNGEPVTSPDQALAFFARLFEGGKVTIDLSRRHRPMKIRLNIG